MPDLDSVTLLIIAAGFALGGLSKGIFGLGMPIMAMPVLVTVLPYQVAVAVFLVPNFTANFQQALRKGMWRQNLRRYKRLIIPLVLIVPLAVQILVRIEQDTGLMILGVIALAFVVSQVLPLKFTIDTVRERWFSPLVGVGAGIVGGISGLYGPILMTYMLALRVPKDEFVSALALMYFLGSFPLYGSLAVAEVLTLEVAAVSLMGAVIIGLMILIGQRLRDRLDEDRYRKLVLGLLFIIGCDLLRRALT